MTKYRPRALITLTLLGFGALLCPSLSLASTYGSNFLTGGTASASDCYSGDCTSGTYGAEKAFDESSGTFWLSTTGSGHWIKYHTTGAHSIGKITLSNGDPDLKNWTLEGSNNDSNWTVITTGSFPETANHTQEYIVDNSTSTFTYYRLSYDDSWNIDGYIDLREFAAQECTDCGAPVTSGGMNGLDVTLLVSALLFLFFLILWGGRTVARTVENWSFSDFPRILGGRPKRIR